MNPHTHYLLIFDKGVKPSSGIKTAIPTNGAGSTGGQDVEEYKLIHSYLPEQSSCPSGSRTST
jgi:hypothetical protein